MRRRVLRASAGIACHFVAFAGESLQWPMISVAAFFPRFGTRLGRCPKYIGVQTGLIGFDRAIMYFEYSRTMRSEKAKYLDVLFERVRPFL